MTAPRTTVVYKTGYVVVPNHVANDSALSFRARGLLAYMLGRPPGWAFNAERICQDATEGREAIRAALRELARAGYYRTQRVRIAGGRFVTITEVAESPTLLPEPLDPLVTYATGDGFPGAGGLESGDPASGEAAPLVTKENHSRESSLGEVK